MPGNPARLSNPQRAYAAGLRVQLLGQTPHRAHLLQQHLQRAQPEVQAAYRAGASASPTAPIPGPAQLLAAVVREMAGGLS